MDQDDALQILTLLISLSQSQDIVSRKEMLILNSHPVQSGQMIDWVFVVNPSDPVFKSLPSERMFLPD